MTRAERYRADAATYRRAADRLASFAFVAGALLDDTNGDVRETVRLVDQFLILVDAPTLGSFERGRSVGIVADALRGVAGDLEGFANREEEKSR